MKRRRKNPHAVALGRIGGLVRSEAKRRTNRENGRKVGLVISRKKRIAAGRKSKTPTTWATEEALIAAVAAIRCRFGYGAIGVGCAGIRYSGAAFR